MRHRYKLRAPEFFAAALIFLCLLSPVTSPPARAYCYACDPSDTTAAENTVILPGHETAEQEIITDTQEEFLKHENWMIETFFKQNLLRAMMMMTEQLTAVAMHQVMIIGTFLDAKYQLETQRLFQELQFQAHRDYQPSEEVCWFGTNARSLGASLQIGRYNKLAIAERQVGRQLGNQNVTGSESRAQDKATRWERFVHRYCDPQDNDWRHDESDSGFEDICKPANNDNTALVNLDIDYTRLVDAPRSLNIFFHKAPLSKPFDKDRPEPNEEDVLAMADNLYGHDVLTRDLNDSYLREDKNQQLYLTLRSIEAKRSVARNTYNSIIGLKAYGSSDDEDKNYFSFKPYENSPPETRRYLARIMIDLGIPKEEVFDMIGLQPSYYAQLEILGKKIYQNPTFYASLYDTPVNVARKGAAMKAVELMLDREMYESQLRREMALSVLLSTRLRTHFKNVDKDMPSAGGS
jgi:hypothetical protein